MINCLVIKISFLSRALFLSNSVSSLKNIERMVVKEYCRSQGAQEQVSAKALSTKTAVPAHHCQV